MKSSSKQYPPLDEIDLSSWCQKLNCTEEELLFCTRRVGTSWICVEAFWSMNRERIRFSVSKSPLESFLKGAQVNRLS